MENTELKVINYHLDKINRKIIELGAPTEELLTERIILQFRKDQIELNSDFDRV